MIKSYTDLSQSRKLAEILPLESADMYYMETSCNNYTIGVLQRMEKDMLLNQAEYYKMFPCWSLAALLEVLPKEIEIDGQHYAPCLFPVKSKWLLKLWYNSNHTFTSPIAIFSDNPVDACVAMIEKLHKLKML